MMTIALVNETGLVVQVEADGNQFEVASPLKWVSVPAGATVEPLATIYDEQTGSFSTIEEPLADAQAFRLERLHQERLARIADVLGTTLEDLPNAEARVLRVSQAAQDAIANPTAWHGKTLAKQVLPADDAGVVAAAQTIIDQQRAMNEQIEQINLTHDNLAAQVQAATTAAEVWSVIWT